MGTFLSRVERSLPEIIDMQIILFTCVLLGLISLGAESAVADDARTLNPLGDNHTSITMGGVPLEFEWSVTQSAPSGHVYFRLLLKAPITVDVTHDATFQGCWNFYNSADTGAAVLPIALPLRPKLIIDICTSGLVCPYTDHVVKNNYQVKAHMEYGFIGDILHPLHSEDAWPVNGGDYLPEPSHCPWDGWYMPNTQTGIMIPKS